MTPVETNTLRRPGEGAASSFAAFSESRVNLQLWENIIGMERRDTDTHENKVRLSMAFEPSNFPQCHPSAELPTESL